MLRQGDVVKHKLTRETLRLVRCFPVASCCPEAEHQEGGHSDTRPLSLIWRWTVWHPIKGEIRAYDEDRLEPAGEKA